MLNKNILIGIITILLIFTYGCNKVSNDSITGGAVAGENDNTDTNLENNKEFDKISPEENGKGTIEENINYNLARYEYLFSAGDSKNIEGKIIYVNKINTDTVILEVDGEKITLPKETIRTMKGINLNFNIIRIINDENVILKIKKSEKVGEKYRYQFNPVNIIDYDGLKIKVELRNDNKAVVDVNGETATFTIDNSKDINGINIEIYEIGNDAGVDYDFVGMLVKKAKELERNND